MRLFLDDNVLLDVLARRESALNLSNGALQNEG
jgi:hypothetical protein